MAGEVKNFDSLDARPSRRKPTSTSWQNVGKAVFEPGGNGRRTVAHRWYLLPPGVDFGALDPRRHDVVWTRG